MPKGSRKVYKHVSNGEGKRPGVICGSNRWIALEEHTPEWNRVALGDSRSVRELEDPKYELLQSTESIDELSAGLGIPTHDAQGWRLWQYMFVWGQFDPRARDTTFIEVWGSNTVSLDGKAYLVYRDKRWIGEKAACFRYRSQRYYLDEFERLESRNPALLEFDGIHGETAGTAVLVKLGIDEDSGEQAVKAFYYIG